MALRVSDNRRFLVHEDGTPYFYLADTAWELFHRLTTAEARIYLEDRAAKGFTAIQAVALAELDGLNDPSALGTRPLMDNDPTQPNDAYFHHVDQVVAIANSLGLVIAMLPTWGDKWHKKWGGGPEIFTPENARTYGQWLGNRYASAEVIWVLGGDRPVETDEHRAILTAMAEGLKQGDDGKHLATFHPMGGGGSSEAFPDADWLDFHMWQSGHGRNTANYAMITKDYERERVKPVLDGEPGYEDHASAFDINNGYLDDYDNRKAAFWSVFAGACGHTYGCHPIWQFWAPGRNPLTWCRRDWRSALALPGSGQMRRVKDLVLSRPYLRRIPDQTLILSGAGEGSNHIQAARDSEGRYAFVYVPTHMTVEVDLYHLQGEVLRVWWYDPRTGTSRLEGEIDKTKTAKFTPPHGGPDWVLVLDDVSAKFGRPGV